MVYYFLILFWGKIRFIFICINLLFIISLYGVVDGKDYVVVGGFGVFKFFF